MSTGHLTTAPAVVAGEEASGVVVASTVLPCPTVLPFPDTLWATVLLPPWPTVAADTLPSPVTAVPRVCCASRIYDIRRTYMADSNS